MMFNMSTSSRLVIFVFGFTFLGSRVYSLRCYVCDSDKTSQINCDNFDPTNAVFAKECPPDKTHSCFASLSNGRVTSRDCEGVSLIGCSRANNIDYCYCSEDLCNSEWLLNGDDEDDGFEGSGRFSTSTTTVPTATVSLTTPISQQNMAFCTNAKIHIVLISAIQYFIQQYYYYY